MFFFQARPNLGRVRWMQRLETPRLVQITKSKPFPRRWIGIWVPPCLLPWFSNKEQLQRLQNPSAIEVACKENWSGCSIIDRWNFPGEVVPGIQAIHTRHLGTQANAILSYPEDARTRNDILQAHMRWVRSEKGKVLALKLRVEVWVIMETGGLKQAGQVLAGWCFLS